MFKLMICGRLTQSPALNESANGTNYTQNCVAYTQKDKDGVGNVKELVWFINFSLFSQRAEYLCKYAKKGSRIILDGTLAQEDFVNKDGQKTSRLVLKDISTLKIIDFADDIQATPNTTAGAFGFAKPKQENRATQANEIKQNTEIDNEEENLPF